MNIHPSIAAIAIVVLCSITDVNANDTDWVLSINDNGKIENICAKDADGCYKAIDAIRTEMPDHSRTKWPIASKDAELICRPSPGCFNKQSNCISNYNC